MRHLSPQLKAAQRPPVPHPGRRGSRPRLPEPPPPRGWCRRCASSCDAGRGGGQGRRPFRKGTALAGQQQAGPGAKRSGWRGNRRHHSLPCVRPHCSSSTPRRGSCALPGRPGRPPEPSRQGRHAGEAGVQRLCLASQPTGQDGAVLCAGRQLLARGRKLRNLAGEHGQRAVVVGSSSGTVGQRCLGIRGP